MCKQHDLYFDCGHKISVRYSTCNFAIRGVHPDGVSEWKACLSESYLARDIYVLCSKCYLAEKKVEFEFKAEALRLGMIYDGEFMDVELWKSEQISLLEKSLPRRRPEPRNRHSKREISWSSKIISDRTTSLLRYEVKPEDVVGHNEWEKRLAEDYEVPAMDGHIWIGDWKSVDGSDCDTEDTDSEIGEYFEELGIDAQEVANRNVNFNEKFREIFERFGFV